MTLKLQLFAPLIKHVYENYYLVVLISFFSVCDKEIVLVIISLSTFTSASTFGQMASHYFQVLFYVMQNSQLDQWLQAVCRYGGQASLSLLHLFRAVYFQRSSVYSLYFCSHVLSGFPAWLPCRSDSYNVFSDCRHMQLDSNNWTVTRITF